VPLICPDEVAGVIEGEPLLVVRFDALNQFIVSDRESGPLACGQEVIYRYPSPRLKRQSQGVRGMAKMLGQELSDRHQVAIHRSLLIGWLPRKRSPQRPINATGCFRSFLCGRQSRKATFGLTGG